MKSGKPTKTTEPLNTRAAHEPSGQRFRPKERTFPKPTRHNREKRKATHGERVLRSVRRPRLRGLVARWLAACAGVWELLWSAHVASLFSVLFSGLMRRTRNFTVSVTHFLYSDGSPRPAPLAQIWAGKVNA